MQCTWISIFQLPPVLSHCKYKPLQILVFIHHCTRNVIITLYFVSLILKLSILRSWSLGYGKTQTDLISRAIDQFDWVNLLLDKNVNEQVILSNLTILNIFHNFIPNKIILSDDSDPPWWMAGSNTQLKRKKNYIFLKKSQTQPTMPS